MGFPAAATYPESSQATTALVLGIVGILCCGPLSIVGWVMANNELNAIQSGMRSPENEGLAKSAKVVGIIGTVLIAVQIVVGILFLTGAIFTPFFRGS